MNRVWCVCAYFISFYKYIRIYIANFAIQKSAKRNESDDKEVESKGKQKQNRK